MKEKIDNLNLADEKIEQFKTSVESKISSIALKNRLLEKKYEKDRVKLIEVDTDSYKNKSLNIIEEWAKKIQNQFNVLFSNYLLDITTINLRKYKGNQ